MPSEELLVQYAEASKSLGRARLAGDVSGANDRAAAVWEISRELRRRGDQKSLLVLLRDDDPWVRLSAGTDALSIAPAEGEAVLTELVGVLGDTALGPKVMLDLWREGRLPTP